MVEVSLSTKFDCALQYLKEGCTPIALAVNILQYSPVLEAMMALHMYVEMIQGLDEEYQTDGGVYASEWTL